MRSLLVLTLAGCWTSHAPASPSADPAPPRPVPADAAVPPACPASFAAATGSCSAYTQWCEYPEGDCGCTYDVPEHCGGARVPPPKPGTPTVWKCTPKPPEFRADGCPGARPNGRACSSEGKVCTYQTCCFFQYTCTGGQWTETAGACPP